MTSRLQAIKQRWVLPHSCLHHHCIRQAKPPAASLQSSLWCSVEGLLWDGWSSDAVVIDYLLEQSSWNSVCVKSDPLSHAVLFHCPRQAQSAQLSPAQRKQSVYTPPTMRGMRPASKHIHHLHIMWRFRLLPNHTMSHSCYAVPFEFANIWINKYNFVII